MGLVPCWFRYVRPHGIGSVLVPLREASWDWFFVISVAATGASNSLRSTAESHLTFDPALLLMQGDQGDKEGDVWYDDDVSVFMEKYDEVCTTWTFVCVCVYVCMCVCVCVYVCV